MTACRPLTAQLKNMNNINQWKNRQFESSTTTTAQFASFARAYKKALTEVLGHDFELISWKRGHFYVSAFFKNKTVKRFIYLSCSNVRFFPNEWYFNILIRTAKHEKDYTGGSNNFTSLYTLYEDAMRLTKENIW
jgi:hypothetical protein